MKHAQVPLDRSTYVISTGAHFTGLLLNSLLLGIVVAKGKISPIYECLCQRFNSLARNLLATSQTTRIHAASLPTAKMVFSNVIVVRTRNHVQQLMVRVGNARGNILYSPDIRFAYGPPSVALLYVLVDPQSNLL